MAQPDQCDEMSQPSAPDSLSGSNGVGVLGNRFTTGAVLATDQSRSITTAATGLKNEVENNTFSINYILCEGDYNHSVQGATNTNSQDRGDGRPLASPLPSPSKSLSDSTGLLPSHTTLPGPGTSDSMLPDWSSLSTYMYDLPSRPDSVAIPDWASHFENLGAKVRDTYVYVLSQVDAKRARRSGEQKKQFKFQVNLQKDTFAMAIESFITTLNNMSLATEELGAGTKDLCEKACQILDDIWVQLQNFRVSVETFRTAETKDKKKKRDLADSFGILQSRLDAFGEAALSIIPADPIPDLSATRTSTNAQDPGFEFREVDRLSTEGRVSSMLHQCLCRACPEQCHDRHTTYLSLQPEETGAASLPSPSEIVGVIWQCHMAFQSTISKDPFIWLRVVSSAAGATETDFTEVGSECKDWSKAEFQESSTEATTGNPRKRRATSTPLEPSPKAQKTRPSQNVRRISQPAPRLITSSRFEVCPELLAQHDLDTVVMNLFDDHGYNHNIFYLPKEKRPISEAAGDPIPLSEILDKRKSRPATGRMGRKYVLRLSRLIAEAVLRFDLRDSDPSPEKSVVFYTSPRNRLIPFLKKVIRKSGHASTAVEEEDSSSSRRSVLLANLGHIMLQLGLMKEERVRDDPPQDLSDRRNYIQRVAPEVLTEMGPRYHQVILQCVSLSALDGDSGVTFDDGFKQMYYHSVVKPLKDMEEFLEKHGKK